MAMMENAVHAKSYSNIFLTLASREEIDEIFRWVEDNPHLQRKAHIVADYYEALEGEGTINALFFGNGDTAKALEFVRLMMRQEYQPATPTFLNAGRKRRGELVSSKMYEVDHYVILYVNASKKAWVYAEGDYAKNPDIRAFGVTITEDARTELFARLAEINA